MNSKRLYKTASVVPVEGGWVIELDGRCVHTPSGHSLSVPVQPLADAIAQEWEKQGETVQPATMPLCGLANAAIDRIGPQREVYIDKIEQYCKSDMVCYRAEAPNDLVKRQHVNWQSLIDWTGEQFGADFKSTSGIVHISQSEESIAAIRREIEKMDDFTLAGFSDMAGMLGSVIIALALFNGRLDTQQAFDAAFLDELHQIERWGDDAEAADRRKGLRGELEATVYFLTLL